MLYLVKSNLDREVTREVTIPTNIFVYYIIAISVSQLIQRLIIDNYMNVQPLQDRRPSSNADPYTVTNRIVKTICLGE